jgi:hypothetical protein
VCSVCNEPGHEGACAPSSKSAPPSGAPHGGTSSSSSSSGLGGKETGGARSDGGTPPHPPAKDRQAAFSFTGNLLAGTENADGFAALFRAFYMALDERQISYLQGTVQVVLQAEAAEQIQQRLTELGISVTFKEI